MNQKLVFVVAFLLLTTVIHSQETLKKALEGISNELCVKLANKNIKRVVVLFVTDISKNETTAGKYMADIVSYHIVNDANNFSVFDRENLSGIAEAKRLIAEGYIDADNAKQLGKLLSVDAIIIGNYTVLTSISLTLKALDVNDGFIVAQSLRDLPKDKDAAALLGVSFEAGADNSLNRGFNNRPMNSNESYNNPETVNKDCETNNTGDYCFQNLTGEKVRVQFSVKGFRGEYCTLEPNQTQCFYNLKENVYSYGIFFPKDEGVSAIPSMSGQVLVEKCKSKTFIIKSNDEQNKLKSVIKECETNNSGDYCFQNLTNKRLKVFVSHVGECIVEPAQTQCFYNVKAASYAYEIEILENKVTYRPVYEKAYAKGNILIEKCKSKTFIIK